MRANVVAGVEPPPASARASAVSCPGPPARLPLARRGAGPPCAREIELVVAGNLSARRRQVCYRSGVAVAAGSLVSVGNKGRRVGVGDEVICLRMSYLFVVAGR